MTWKSSLKSGKLLEIWHSSTVDGWCGVKQSITLVSGQPICLLAWAQDAPGAPKYWADRGLHANTQGTQHRGTSYTIFKHILPKGGHFCLCTAGAEGLLTVCGFRGKQQPSKADKKRINRLFPSVAWTACKVLPVFVEPRSLPCSRLRFTCV